MAYLTGNLMPQDYNHVNVVNAAELTYWTRYFGISEARLKDCVKVAGTEKDRIMRYLRSR